MNTKNKSGIFWGIALIVIGLLFLIKISFHIEVPIVRLLMASALVLLGIRMLTGRNAFLKAKSNSVFGENHFVYSQGVRNYSTVMGEGRLTITTADLINDTYLEISCVMGSFIILVSPDIPLTIHSTSVLASFTNPKGHTSTIGSSEYIGKKQTPSQPALTIHASVVLGNMEVKYL
jgi:predicted membrane protein